MTILYCNSFLYSIYLLGQSIDNDGEESVGGVELEEVHRVVEGVGRPVGVDGEEELGFNLVEYQLFNRVVAVTPLGQGNSVTVSSCHSNQPFLQ